MYEQKSYKDLGFDTFLTKSIETARKQTPLETRNATQPGALVSDSVYVTTVDLPLKVDKDGIYLGSPAPDYAESRLKYDFSTHKLYVGGQTDWEALN